MIELGGVMSRQEKLTPVEWEIMETVWKLAGAPSVRDVLEQALMLGLCTAQIFDADRPVLWTETSLTRAVELFDPVGFYA